MKFITVSFSSRRITAALLSWLIARAFVCRFQLCVAAGTEHVTTWRWRHRVVTSRNRSTTSSTSTVRRSRERSVPVWTSQLLTFDTRQLKRGFYPTQRTQRKQRNVRDKRRWRNDRFCPCVLAVAFIAFVAFDAYFLSFVALDGNRALALVKRAFWSLCNKLL